MDINKYQDMIDTREILEYIEELEEDEEENEEKLDTLRQLIKDVDESSSSSSLDGVTLIRDSHFTRYVQEYCDEIGVIPENFPFWISIDWESTARDFQSDWMSVEYDGVTYWIQ